jgi:hypothetical protein
MPWIRLRRFRLNPFSINRQLIIKGIIGVVGTGLPLAIT